MKTKLALAILGLMAAGLLSGCNVSPLSSFGAANEKAADPKAKSGASLGEAVLGDDKGVKPAIALEGEFDSGKALRAMYGSSSYNADLKRAQWRPTKGELDRFSFYNDIKTLYSKAYFTKNFQQGTAERYFVITRTAPSKADCEDCVPVLGGAVFTKTGEEWTLDQQSRAITRTGLHGELSGGRVVKIGAEKYGVMFHWKATNLGVTEEGDLLIAETKSGLKEVFSMVTGGNNKKYCEENGLYADDPTCWAYSSKLDFVANADSPVYDLRVSSTGTKQIEDNEVAPVRETKRFAFSESGYRPYR